MNFYHTEQLNQGGRNGSPRDFARTPAPVAF